MTYRACIRLRVADGTYRFKGDPIPEAAGWPAAIRAKRLKQGVIEKIADPAKPKAKRKAKKG
jgi:hypothetical protein